MMLIHERIVLQQGRESGMIQKFSIASGNLAEVVVNESVGIIPAKISVNSNSTYENFQDFSLFSFRHKLIAFSFLQKNGCH